MKEETAEALVELGRAVAQKMGANPDDVVIAVSRPGFGPAGELSHNSSCTRCGETYFDESGCDPCPHCGASYFAQIFPGLNCRPRLARVKRRIRSGRRRRRAGRAGKC